MSGLLYAGLYTGSHYSNAIQIHRGMKTTNILPAVHLNYAASVRNGVAGLLAAPSSPIEFQPQRGRRCRAASSNASVAGGDAWLGVSPNRERPKGWFITTNG